MSGNITPKTIRKLNRDHAGDYVIMVVLGLFAVLTFYPMWYVVVGSFSEGADYIKGGVYFFPRVFTLENYKVIVSSKAVWRSIGVTVARCALGPTISVLFTAFVAYGMSRKELRFKKLFNFAGIFTMFFSGGLIPYYLLCKILGFINNFFVYIIPGAYSVYNMILIRSFFRNMPEELHEATVLDGASEYLIFFKFMIPLSMPILTTIFLWSLVAHWNDYLTSMLYLPTATRLHTLQYVLQKIISNADGSSDSLLGTSSTVTSESISFAAMVFGTIPMLVMYPFMQKHFVSGIYVGSLKG